MEILKCTVHKNCFRGAGGMDGLLKRALGVQAKRPKLSEAPLAFACKMSPEKTCTNHKKLQ